MKSGTSSKINFWPALALLLLSFTLAWIFWLGGRKNRAVQFEPVFPVFGTLPDFSLTDQNGKTFSLSNLKGEVWIADFIFTHCSGICPLMTGKMKNLQEKIGIHPGIQFVSFSVDPDRDTPETLQSYGEQYKAGLRWTFLTGDKKQIYGLSVQHFQLGVEEIPNEEREEPNQSVRHSSKFVLVDQKARIRGYYDSESQDLEKLARDAVKLAAMNP